MSDSDSEESYTESENWAGAFSGEDESYVVDTRFVKGTFEVEFGGISRILDYSVNIGGLGWSCTVDLHVDDASDDEERYLSVEITASGRKKLKHFQCHAACEVILKNRSTGPDLKWEFSETFAGTYKSSFKKLDFIEWHTIAKQNFASMNSIILQISISPDKVTEVVRPVSNGDQSDENDYSEYDSDLYNQPLLSEVTKAILLRDHKLLSDLICQDPDVLRLDDKSTGRSPLVEAIIFGDYKSIQIILGKEMEALQLPRRTSPICAAVHLLGRALKTWNCLVEHGFNINSVGDNNRDENPLHYACRNGASKEVIEFLLRKGCLAAANIDDQLPHHAAADKKNIDALNVLLEHDFQKEVTHSDIHYLDLAKKLAIHDNLEILKVVFQRYGEKILRGEAAENVIRDEAAENVFRGDAAENESSLLHHACKGGSSELVQFLVHQGCSTTSREFDRYSSLKNILPHHVAAQRSNPAALNVLLQHDLRANIKHENEDYFHLAKQIAKYGDLELLQLIFGHYKPQIVQKDSGDEMLKVLIENNHFASFQFALSAGCGFPQELSTSCEFKSLNAAIKHHDPKYFSVLYELLTPDVVTKCTVSYKTELMNKLRNNDSLYSYWEQHPISVAIKSKQVDRLTALLKAGFPPNFTLIKESFQQKLYAESILKRFSCEAGVRHSILSFTMMELPSEESEVTLKTIQVLLDYGAQVDGDSPLNFTASQGNGQHLEVLYKMPPILAAVWNVSSDFVQEDPAISILRMLIDHGANFHYRKPDSIFASSDCAVLAAFLVNVTLLAHALGSGSSSSEVVSCGNQAQLRTPSGSNSTCSSHTGVETFSNVTTEKPLNLLNDMIKFQIDQPHWNVLSDVPAALRNGVALSVNTALKFADGRDKSELTEASEKLDRKFRFVRTRLGRRRALRLATNADSKWAIPNSNSEDDDNDDGAWERVRSTLKSIGSLQHMCRVVINRQLVRCDPRFTRSIEECVRQLPVPDALKSFL